MTFENTYRETAPTREQVDALAGAVVLEFGTGWCGHCQAASPLVQALLADQDDVAHLRIEDGRGRPLGRSYGVKLWPTLVMLRDGREVARVVRPTRGELQQALDQLQAPSPDEPAAAQ